jgi:hypothetical protein
MKTTVTETIDKNGRVTKRVTVTEDEQYPVMPIYPAPYIPLRPPDITWPPYTPQVTCNSIQ